MTTKKNRYKFIVTVRKQYVMIGDPEHEIREETIFEQTVSKLDLKNLITAINPE